MKLLKTLRRKIETGKCSSIYFPFKYNNNKIRVHYQVQLYKGVTGDFLCPIPENVFHVPFVFYSNIRSECLFSKDNVNPFAPSAPFFYPMKTSENRKGTNGLTEVVIHLHCLRVKISKCPNFSNSSDLKCTLSVFFWNKRYSNQGRCKLI